MKANNYISFFLKKMKLPIAALLTIFVLNFQAKAQLSKTWDFRFGGTAIDEFHDVISTSDGGYLLAGYSESGVGGDKATANQGSGDFWIIKIDNVGVKQWEKDFGGNNYDELFEAQQTTDGGYILGGWSNSGISGDKSEASIGAGDYWVVKTDQNGNLQWNKTFGGTSEDYLQAIKQTSDGGYILAGRSNSGISGNKTQANRGTVGVTWDYWVVKIDATGTKQWDQTYGGFDDDQLFSAQQTSDGGYIFGGYSGSGITGEKSQASQGLDDYWIVKTDVNGVKQWDKSFGGTSADQLQMLIQTSDGGYLMGGGSASGATGDKSQASRGNFDYWVVKTTAAGAKQWDKRFGGTSADNLFDVIQTNDGGYLLGGASSSAASGDKSQGNRGTVGTTYDYWVVKISATGSLQVEKRFGGSSDEYAKSITETSDGSYLVAGWSTSGLSGDKSQASRGSIDYWLSKISGPNSITTLALTSPQCAGSLVNVDFTVTGTFNAGNTFTAQLSDATGSFAAPVDIGTLSGTTGGTIPSVLSLVTLAGTQYKIRVISDNPVATDVYASAAFQIDAPTLYYLDADNDTYGNIGNYIYACNPVAGYVTNGLDCNDNDATSYQIPSGQNAIISLSSNCEGSSANSFDADKIQFANSYHWFLTPGLSAANTITSDTLIAINIGLGTASGTIKVVGENSCGTSDTAYYNLTVALLPVAASAITGSTQISSCNNQKGISYSIAPIANATSYNWSLPDSANFVGNPNSNSIVVDYSPYGVAGNISVYGSNSCGVGASSTNNISYYAIPKAEICGISVDSATQKGILKWQRPLESYADSIVVLRKNISSSKYEKIATLNNVSPSEYLDLSAQSTPDLKAETYKLAVKDSCGFIGDSSVAVSHRTIFLYGLTGWSSIPKLYWTPYEGINDTGRYYNVLRDSSGSGVFKIIKDSIKYTAPLNYTDPDGAACFTCRYVVELVYLSDCNPNLRIMTNKSTSRSNVANRAAMPFDPLLTDIRSLNTGIKFSLQPNPAHENIVITFDDANTHVELELLNLLGEKVYSNKFSEITSNAKRIISVENFTKGVYLLKLSSNRGAAFAKIVLY